MSSPSERDRKLDDEARRLKSAADKSESSSEKAMFEGFSRFYESIAEDGRPDGEDEDSRDGGAADDRPVRGE